MINVLLESLLLESDRHQDIRIFQLPSSNNIKLTCTGLWNKRLGCMHFCLPNSILPFAFNSNKKYFFNTLKILWGFTSSSLLLFCQVISRLLTLPEYIYAHVYVSDVLILTVSFKLVNFVFQYFPFHSTKVSTSFLLYITLFTFFHFTWVLQQL